MSDEIKDLLADAVSIVDDANIPSDLREIAYSKAVDLLANRGAHGSRATSADPAGRRAESSASWIKALSIAMGRDPVELEEVFFSEDDETPLVGVNPIHLGDNAAERSRSVALLVAGARQVSGLEQATSSEVIRQECKRLGVFDSGNFSTTIGRLKDWFNITGTGKTKAFRMKPGGRDAFRALLDELLRDDGG